MQPGIGQVLGYRLIPRGTFPCSATLPGLSSLLQVTAEYSGNKSVVRFSTGRSRPRSDEARAFVSLTMGTQHSGTDKKDAGVALQSAIFSLVTANLLAKTRLTRSSTCRDQINHGITPSNK